MVGTWVVALEGNRLHLINPVTWSDQPVYAPFDGTINGMATYDGIAYIMAGDCFITASPSVFMPKLSLEVSVRSGGLGAINPQPLPAPTQPVTLPATSAPRCP